VVRLGEWQKDVQLTMDYPIGIFCVSTPPCASQSPWDRWWIWRGSSPSQHRTPEWWLKRWRRRTCCDWVKLIDQWRGSGKIRLKKD